MKSTTLEFSTRLFHFPILDINYYFLMKNKDYSLWISVKNSSQRSGTNFYWKLKIDEIGQFLTKK